MLHNIADLDVLLKLQEEHEERVNDRLKREMEDVNSDKITYSYIHFAFSSLGQFVGAFGDMCKPVSLGAQGFEIIVSLLRAIFATVFFSTLIEPRKSVVN